MNGLDDAIIVIIAIGALHGLSQGALRMATSAGALIAGLYFASADYQPVGAIIQRHFGTGQELSAVLGFLAVLLAIFVIVGIAGSRLIGLLQIVNLTWADRMCSSTSAR